jgi:hypothetical protein
MHQYEAAAATPAADFWPDRRVSALLQRLESCTQGAALSPGRVCETRPATPPLSQRGRLHGATLGERGQHPSPTGSAGINTSGRPALFRSAISADHSTTRLGPCSTTQKSGVVPMDPARCQRGKVTTGRGPANPFAHLGSCKWQMGSNGRHSSCRAFGGSPRKASRPLLIDLASGEAAFRLGAPGNRAGVWSNER